MGKIGRPTKRTAGRRRSIVEAIAKGYGLVSAAKVSGISPALMMRWRNEDAEFRRETDEAREYCCDVVEHRLFADAMRGSTLAQLAYLRARRPEYYRARTVIAGDPDSPLAITHSIEKPRIVILPNNNRPVLSEEEIKRERAAVAREDLLAFDDAGIEPGE
jgi:hypothetical protein